MANRHKFTHASSVAVVASDYVQEVRQTAYDYGEIVGKPFSEELDALGETYRWALSPSAPRLADDLARLRQRPLCAVGSGGSLTTAEVASGLFGSLALGLASAVTPAELSARASVLRDSSVLLATAGGGNPDVLGAMRVAATNDAAFVLALCASHGSRLAKQAERYNNVAVVEFEPPSGRDGFLATNSLLASAVLLVRGLCEVTRQDPRLPKSLPSLVKARTWQSFTTSLTRESTPLWSRESIVILHGPSTRAPAIDLESKFTEAALANCSVADFRQFGHGRHHWFAKRAASSAVIAFVAHSDKALAEKTLSEIPQSSPRLLVEVDDGPRGMLAALAHVFPIIAACGQSRSIDPGRPGVPAFGRKIYRINAFGRDSSLALPNAEQVAIERKARKSRTSLEREGAYRFWLRAHDRALEAVNTAKYSGVVFDYDGTLCSPAERLGRCRPEVADVLKALISGGVTVGIATGRGKSVRESLREALPKKYWKAVVVGYYNGGQIALLSDVELPDGTPVADADLGPVLKTLKRSKRLSQIADIDARKRQLTVTVKLSSNRDECFRLLDHLIATSPGLAFTIGLLDALVRCAPHRC